MSLDIQKEAIGGWVEGAKQFAFQYAPRLAGAILVFVVGLWFINRFTAVVKKGMIRRGLDVSLHSFLASLLNVALKVMLIITVAGMIGIETTSFVAILGAAGLAVGLALQGSLSNFAGGVLTLVFKPYKVGDFIEAQGQIGTVKEIQIFNTILLTQDNRTAILPNGAVSNGTIINYSRHGDLRLDIPLEISADNDYERVEQILLDVCNHEELILKDPVPSVLMSKLAGGNMQLTLRLHVLPGKNSLAQSVVLKKARLAFIEKGILWPGDTKFILKEPTS